MKRSLIICAILLFSLPPLAAQTLTLVSPNGGENWAIGSMATVSWNSSGVATVRLILYKGGTAAENRIGVIVSGLQASSGSYSWTVGSYSEGTAPAGADYSIRIMAEGTAIDDFSAGPFTLSEKNDNMPEGSIKVSCGETGYLLEMNRCSNQN